MRHAERFHAAHVGPGRTDAEDLVAGFDVDDEFRRQQERQAHVHRRQVGNAQRAPVGARVRLGRHDGQSPQTKRMRPEVVRQVG